MQQFHFVLVHGACHGAWCWYKLISQLQVAGHSVTALDLGGCGFDPRPVTEIRTLDDYVEPLMNFMESHNPHESDENVILVGHSFGGIAISLAMEKFPQKILVAVYVTAYMPSCSNPPLTLVQETFRRTPVEEFLDTTFFFENGQENGPTSVIFGPDHLSNKLYQYCQPQDLELAKALVKPAGLFMEDMATCRLFTEHRFGAVKRVYVICEEDKLVSVENQRWMIKESPPSMVKSIPKADHMVMLSRPQELCHILLEITNEIANQPALSSTNFI